MTDPLTPAATPGKAGGTGVPRSAEEWERYRKTGAEVLERA
jgi:hypothetical protein